MIHFFWSKIQIDDVMSSIFLLSVAWSNDDSLQWFHSNMYSNVQVDQERRGDDPSSKMAMKGLGRLYYYNVIGFLSNIQVFSLVQK